MDEVEVTTNATESPSNGFIQSSSANMLTFAAIMTILIMTVGIIGNFLTVAALIKCPKVRNVAAAFIMSLCIADLLFCALVLPFNAYRFIQGIWLPGEFLCRMIPFIQYGNIGVSLLCIAMITINRYVMIAHHSSYGHIYQRHWIAVMIIFCWVFSYGMQLPTLMGVWGTFGYDPKLGTCSIMSDGQGRSSKTALFITAFVIPCIIIIACYAKIFWVVHRSEQRLKRHAKQQHSMPNNLRILTTASGEQVRPSGGGNTSNTPPIFSEGNGRGSMNRSSSIDSSSCSHELKPSMNVQGQHMSVTRGEQQREVRAKRNEWRITKMVLAIFLSFVVCYLPITIAKVSDQEVNYPNAHLLSYIMLYLSACLNPIIYVIMNKQYRKAYRTVLRCHNPETILVSIKCCGKQQRRNVRDNNNNNNNNKHHRRQSQGRSDYEDDDAPDGILRLNGPNAVNGRRRESDLNSAEKWKDGVSSYNHSRTVISQVSITDSLPTTSCSRSPSPVKSNTMTAEMVPDHHSTRNYETTINATPSTPATTMVAGSPMSETNAVIPVQVEAGTFVVHQQQQQPAKMTTTTTSTFLSHNNDLWKSSGAAMPVANWSGSPRLLSVRLPKETNRIALVGGDIILEEEEEEEGEGEGEREGENIENRGKEEFLKSEKREKSEKEADEETEDVCPKNDTNLQNNTSNGRKYENGEDPREEELRKLPVRPRSEINVPERVFSPSSSRRTTAPRPVYVNASALKAMKLATNNDKPFY